MDYSGDTEKFSLTEVLFPLCHSLCRLNSQGRKPDWLSWGEYQLSYDHCGGGGGRLPRGTKSLLEAPPLEVRQSMKSVTMS